MISPAKPEDILEQHQHRPVPLPAAPWMYYQGWRQVLFIHFPVPQTIIEDLIPAGLVPDSFDGTTWVSVVSFNVVNTHPRGLSSFSPISNFSELNLRTYVSDGKIPGTHFFDIKANKRIPVLMNSLLGLPYKKEKLLIEDNSVRLQAADNGIALDLSFAPGEVINARTDLDKWLTERYCTYQRFMGALCRYSIHHAEWPLRQAIVQMETLDYRFGPLHLTREANAVAHYSPGVNMLGWLMEKL